MIKVILITALVIIAVMLLASFVLVLVALEQMKYFFGD